MICTLTARRIKAGAGEDFRAAFESAVEGTPEEILKRWMQVYVCRDVTDENVILSFGFFDGSVEELREIQAQQEGESPPEAIASYVEEVLLDGSYQVIDEMTQ